MTDTSRTAVITLAAVGCAGVADARPRSVRGHRGCAREPIRAARAFLDDAGLAALRLSVRAWEPRDQTTRFATEVCFEHAALLAVTSLLLDERNPVSAIGTLRAIDDQRICAADEEVEALLCYLRRPGSRLGLAGRARPPPIWQALDEQWVFWVELPELSADRIYWVAVARSGSVAPRAFNFGTERDPYRLVGIDLGDTGVLPGVR
jgi:hypothetical protein